MKDLAVNKFAFVQRVIAHLDVAAFISVDVLLELPVKHVLPLLTVFLLVTTRLQSAVPDQEARGDLPEWIWSADRTGSVDEVEFHQKVEITGSITEARMKLAADFCRCKVIINGSVAADLDNFGPLVDIEVARFLRRGTNRIQVHSTAAPGPCAVAAAISIRDGEQWQNVSTDATWTVGSARNKSPAVVVSFGQVSPQFWISRRESRVTAFDDYTQWKQAETDSPAKDDAPKISTQPEFEVELVRNAEPNEGSWISMAFDPEGRITIAREDEGLLRLTLAKDDKPRSVENTLKECRGLLYAHGALYANANNAKGLYRLALSTNEGDIGPPELLREFPGGVGHGRNDLALGPDGKIYSIHGDSVQLPQTDITDLTSPYRDGAESGPEAQGHLVRCDSDGNNWELVATGLRNPFGIDFNPNGDVFTYDADAEFDMGAPWYRPTRLDHLAAGADFGWRGLTGKWPPYQLDHADNALPTTTIGKGSPTAVKFGTRSCFPKPWQNALFVLDWAYGRIVACHLFPRGAGYVSRSQVFLKGRPLNVTDLDFGPDGAMYFVTGGRKTESSLYRVRWTGNSGTTDRATQQQQRRQKWSANQRLERRQLETLLHASSNTKATIDAIWPALASDDPSLRQAAQTALEHQPVTAWSRRALTESDVNVSVAALLSLARSAVSQTSANENNNDLSARRMAIVQTLNLMPVEQLSAFRKLAVIRTYTLCLAGSSAIDAGHSDDTTMRLQNWLERETTSSPVDHAPTGAGGNVVANLSRLVMQVVPSSANPHIVQMLENATSQHDRLVYLFLLRTATDGWQVEHRKYYFETLNEIESTFLGGDGMPRFLKSIREDAVRTLSATEKKRLGQGIESSNRSGGEPLVVHRPHVRNWSIDDISSIIDAASDKPGNAANGRKLFDQVLCSRCHRAGRHGGVVGPDLTSVGNRFSHRDLLRSILAPSEVIAEKYRSVTVVTTEGKIVTGRPLSSGDYRSPSVQISTDPLDSSKVVEILKANIDERQPSTVSPMPKDLMSSLSTEDISDLLAFLTSAAESTSGIPAP